MKHLLKGSSKKQKLFLEGNSFIGDFFNETNFWNIRDPFNKMKQFKEAADNANFKLTVFRERNLIEQAAISEDKYKAAKNFCSYNWYNVSQPNIMNQKSYTKELYYDMWEKLGCNVFYPDPEDLFFHFRYAAFH